MDKTPTPETMASCNPVFSMAGAMPGANEAVWKTAYPNPDAVHTQPRPAGHGPSFSIAGVMPGRPEVVWRTAMPDPTRDTLDTYGGTSTRKAA